MVTEIMMPELHSGERRERYPDCGALQRYADCRNGNTRLAQASGSDLLESGTGIDTLRVRNRYRDMYGNAVHVRLRLRFGQDEIIQSYGQGTLSFGPGSLRRT